MFKSKCRPSLAGWLLLPHPGDSQSTAGPFSKAGDLASLPFRGRPLQCVRVSLYECACADVSSRGELWGYYYLEGIGSFFFVAPNVLLCA